MATARPSASSRPPLGSDPGKGNLQSDSWLAPLPSGIYSRKSSRFLIPCCNGEELSLAALRFLQSSVSAPGEQRRPCLVLGLSGPYWLDQQSVLL